MGYTLLIDLIHLFVSVGYGNIMCRVLSRRSVLLRSSLDPRSRCALLAALFERHSVLLRYSRDARSRCALCATLGHAALFVRRSVSLRFSCDTRPSCALFATLGLASVFARRSVSLRSSRDALSRSGLRVTLGLATLGIATLFARCSVLPRFSRGAWSHFGLALVFSRRSVLLRSSRNARSRFVLLATKVWLCFSRNRRPRCALLAKPWSCCALFASDAQYRDALSPCVLRHAFDEALILSSWFGQATRSLPFAVEILRLSVTKRLFALAPGDTSVVSNCRVRALSFSKAGDSSSTTGPLRDRHLWSILHLGVSWIQYQSLCFGLLFCLLMMA